MFDIYMGVPEMEDFWNSLLDKIELKKANKDEIQLYKKLKKVLNQLKKDPKYHGLHSHEISILTERYGMKVFESYLENHKPAAGRIFWVYYPNNGITIIGIEPHPNDKNNAYKKIQLSYLE